jgi:hypothetical protein
MTRYDVVFIQTGTPTPPNYKFKGKPFPRSRVELGTQMYLRHDTNCLFMVGTEDQVPLMKEYASLRGVPKERILTYPNSPTSVTDTYYCFKLLPEVERNLGKRVRKFAFVTNEVEYKTIKNLFQTFARMLKQDVKFEVLGVDSQVSDKKRILRYGIARAKRMKNIISSLGTQNADVFFARDEKLIPSKIRNLVRYLYDK